MQKNGLLLIVEGNIGAGKSSFLSLLQEKLSVNIIHEPTDSWQKTGDGNILDLYYKDMTRWSYTFQSNAFITRVKSLLDQKNLFSEHSIKIVERSVYCDRYCFAKNLYELGHMNKLEWQLYKNTFSWLVKTFMPKPDGFMYLQTSPETCLKRMYQRDRSEESQIPLSYLKLLHKKHEDWLVKKNQVEDSLRTIPVINLDFDNDFTINKKHRLDLLNKVENFIIALQNKNEKENFVPAYKESLF